MFLSVDHSTFEVDVRARLRALATSLIAEIAKKMAMEPNLGFAVHHVYHFLAETQAGSFSATSFGAQPLTLKASIYEGYNPYSLLDIPFQEELVAVAQEQLQLRCTFAATELPMRPGEYGPAEEALRAGNQLVFVFQRHKWTTELEAEEDGVGQYDLYVYAFWGGRNVLRGR